MTRIMRDLATNLSEEAKKESSKEFKEKLKLVKMR